MPRDVCCVPGCPVVAEDGIPLHYFPNPEKEAAKFQNWIKSIGGGIASLDSNIVYKTHRICCQHFPDVFLYPKNRLCKLAIPSLHLPSEDQAIDTDEVKSVHKTSRCCTCLSLDRNLKPLKPQDNIILQLLCPEMFSYAKRSNRYLICWECEHMLIKIKRFQARVSKAQAQLKLTLQEVNSIDNGLSKLKITKIETIDYPPQALEVMLIEQNQQMLKEIPQPVPPTPIKITTLYVDPETINIEVEEEEKRFSCDYDELIPPTKIQQAFREESTDIASESETYDEGVPPQKAAKHGMTAPNDQYIPQKVFIKAPNANEAPRGYREQVQVTDPLRTPNKKTPIVKTNCVTEGVPPQKAPKHGITAPNGQYIPHKVFIKAPNANEAPRGYREQVQQVTGGIPNLVTDETVPIIVKTKSCVPTIVKTSDGFSIVVTDNDGASIVTNDTGNVTDLVNGKVAPNISKHEEPVLRRLIIPIHLNSTNKPPSRKPVCEKGG